MEQVSGSPIQLASNSVQAQAPEKAQPAGIFEKLIKGASSKNADDKNTPAPATNGMQQGAESMAMYLKQMQEISANQQF